MKLRLPDRYKDRLFLITILSPAILLLTFTIGIPIVKSLYMSLYDVSLLNMKNYVWNDFANYKNVFSNNEFGPAVKVTFIYVFVVVAVQFILGMILATILNSKIKYRKFLRTVILIPWIIPTIVAALLWMWLFQPQYGVVNYILMELQIIDQPYAWLQDIYLALPAIMVTALWRQLPFMTTMLLAGMQGISEDMYEAAKIDGANNRQLFTFITLPLLKNTISTVTLIALIENFKMFPLFWIMTGGGPLKATTTLAILSYETAFTDLDLGKGAAIGTLWLCIVMIVAWGYNKLFTLNEAK